MSRITLSERTAIEAGIYGKLSFQKIAGKIGKSTRYVSREILQNRTLVRGEHPHGKDCRLASGCKRGRLCGDESCTRRCAYCGDVDCQTVCRQYNNSPCSMLSKPPYVCNLCPQRRKCRADRAYYIAVQADAAARRRYSEARSKAQLQGEELSALDRLVSPLVKKGQPLTHIFAVHKEDIPVSQRTLYNYISEAIAFAQTQGDGTTVKMIADAETANVVVAASDNTAVLDLNGHNLDQTCPVAQTLPDTADPDYANLYLLAKVKTAAFIAVMGKLSITDSSSGQTGKIQGYVTEDTSVPANSSTILCTGGSSLEVRSGEITGGCFAGVPANAISSGLYDENLSNTAAVTAPISITIAGGVITAKNPSDDSISMKSTYASISMNFSKGRNIISNTTLNISGGRLVSGAIGVLGFLNSYINMSGGTINAGTCGIYAVAQKLAVSGGVIESGINGLCCMLTKEVNVTGGTISATRKPIPQAGLSVGSSENTPLSCGILAAEGSVLTVSGKDTKIYGYSAAVSNGASAVTPEGKITSHNSGKVTLSGGNYKGTDALLLTCNNNTVIDYADGMAMSAKPDSDGWYVCRSKVNAAWTLPDGTVFKGSYPYLYTPTDADYTALGGTAPAMTPADNCKYSFAGWSPAYAALTGDAAYIPVFDIIYQAPENAVDSAKPSNTIDATSSGTNGGESSVTMGASAVTAAANTESLTVKTNAAEVTFNEAALDNISSNSGTSGVTLVTRQLDAADVSKLDQQQQNTVADATAIIDLSLVKTNADGSTEKVPFSSSSDNGAVTVSIPYTPAEGTVPKVYFVDDSGSAALMDTTYANGVLSFTTTHFSVYCVKERNVCTVTFAAGANGTLSGTASLAVDPGYKLTANDIPAVSPAEKYRFAGWQIDGQPADPVGAAVNGDVTYTAVFTRDCYKVSNESGISGLPEKVNAGEDLNFTPAAEGGLVTGVSVSMGGTTQKLAANADGSYTLKAAAITDDVVVSADIIKGAAIKFVTRTDCLALKTGTQIVLLNTAKLSGSKYVLADGTALYWSKVFNAYFAVVGADKTAASVSAGLTTADGDAAQVFLRDVDLNGDGRKNIVDSGIMLYIKGYMVAQEIIKIVNSAE